MPQVPVPEAQWAAQAQLGTRRAQQQREAWALVFTGAFLGRKGRGRVSG